MSLGIRVDISAWDLVRRLNASELTLYASMEKLSSGLKINRASDGPATLVISEQLRSQIATLGQQIENLGLQQSKYEYASSAVMQLRSHLTELRSLATGAANEGFNDPAMQSAYETAAQYVAEDFNRLVESSEYNGRKLFDGAEGSLADLHQLEEIDFSSAAAVEASMLRIEEATREIDQAQVDIGATQKNDLEAQQRSLAITQQNLISAESRLRDTDYAMEYANFLAESMRLQAGISLWAHSKITANAVLNLLGS